MNNTAHAPTAPNQPEAIDGAPESVTVRTLDELKQKLQEGVNAADRGESVPAGEVFTELRQRIETFRK